MDFTRITNDEEGVMDVPRSVLRILGKMDEDYEYSSKCIRTVDEDGETTYNVGIKDAGENLNTAPYLKHDYSYMLAAMEAFKDDDMEKATEGFVKLMNDVPEVSAGVNDRRNPISRAETNVEKCLFQTRDIEAEVQGDGYKGIALLNPSVGTVKRYSEIYPKASVPVYITEEDGKYVRRLGMLCTSLDLAPPNCVVVQSLPAEYVYYAGFRADRMFEYNVARMVAGKRMLQYIGFVPNLLAMACANVDILSYTEEDSRFVYLRKEEEIMVDMDPHCTIVRADVLVHQYMKLKYYNRAQGVMHDMVSSLPRENEVPIIKARPIPVDLIVPKYDGTLYKTQVGMFIGDHLVVRPDGSLNYDAWEIPFFLSDHRYMTGRFHGAIYDAGDTVRVMSIDDYVDQNGKGRQEALKQLISEGVVRYYGKYLTYVSNPLGDVRLRENMYGNIYKGKRRYNKEVVSQYAIGIETAIEYQGDRLEMYGIRHIDMTGKDLEIAGAVEALEEVEFGT